MEMARRWFDRGSERPVADVPPALRATLVMAVLAQLVLAALQPPPVAQAEALPQPPSAGALRALSLGDPVALA
jgi:hypothetical protein